MFLCLYSQAGLHGNDGTPAPPGALKHALLIAARLKADHAELEKELAALRARAAIASTYPPEVDVNQSSLASQRRTPDIEMDLPPSTPPILGDVIESVQVRWFMGLSLGSWGSYAAIVNIEEILGYVVCVTDSFGCAPLLLCFAKVIIHITAYHLSICSGMCTAGTRRSSSCCAAAKRTICAGVSSQNCVTASATC